MNRLNVTLKTLICAAVCSSVFFSCKKDLTEIPSSNIPTTAVGGATNPNLSFTALSAFTQDYSQRANGPYTSDQFVSDHGGSENSKDGNWSTARCKIENNTFVVKLLAGLVGANGGLVSYSNVVDALNYEIKFDIKFSSGFKLIKGGKAGFGFGVGQVAAGGEGAKARTGVGGSYRLMWTNVDTQYGKFKFKPYAYYESMTGNYGGEASSTEYPSGAGEIKTGVWYTVYMQINMNTEGNANGKYIFDVWETANKTGTYQRVTRSNMKWASGTNRIVTQLMCDTFRGGAVNDGYDADTDGWISYDNVVANSW